MLTALRLEVDPTAAATVLLQQPLARIGRILTRYGYQVAMKDHSLSVVESYRFSADGGRVAPTERAVECTGVFDRHTGM
jgi:hypothetical protein